MLVQIKSAVYMSTKHGRIGTEKQLYRTINIRTEMLFSVFPAYGEKRFYCCVVQYLGVKQPLLFERQCTGTGVGA